MNPVCYQEVHDVFCQLDTNQSGGLDEQDLLQAAVGVQGVKNSWRNRVFVDVMMEIKRLSVDANRDGTKLTLSYLLLTAVTDRCGGYWRILEGDCEEGTRGESTAI